MNLSGIQKMCTIQAHTELQLHKSFVIVIISVFLITVTAFILKILFIMIIITLLASTLPIFNNIRIRIRIVCSHPGNRLESTTRSSRESINADINYANFVN